LRSVNSTVEWLGPDEQDPSSVVVKVALVPGLANTNLKIGRDQLEVFLAIIGVASKRDLAGQSVRITVDDEAGTEQIAFPRPLASVAEPAIVAPAVVAPAVDLAAAPVAAGRAAEEGLLVIADSKPADEVTVYDNVAQRVAMPVGEPDDGGDTVAALTRADAASEEQARARIAAAATAPVGRRYFLYRETYGEAARGTTIELTPYRRQYSAPSLAWVPSWLASMALPISCRKPPCFESSTFAPISAARIPASFETSTACANWFCP